MRYRPVRTLVDINELSQAKATEGRSLDFKEHVDGLQWWELAKDIAAFANHVGGSILVGAAEQPDGAAVFFGIDPDAADGLRTRYENAAKDRCKPRPLVDVEPIALPSTKVVLAVNVEPFPLGPVGAAFYVIGQDDKPASCDAWRFPVRVGKNNVPLQPDQIAMFMEPRIRRIVTLLEEAISPPKPEKPPAALFLVVGSGAMPETKVEIRDVVVDVQINALVFTNAGSRMHVPLDDVEAVWQRDSTWQIRVSGVVTGVNNERHYASMPQRF